MSAGRRTSARSTELAPGDASPHAVEVPAWATATARAFALLAVSWAASGCATAKLVPAPRPDVPSDGQRRVLVIEPLFEEAGWEDSQSTQYRPAGMPGSPLPQGMAPWTPLDGAPAGGDFTRPLRAHTPVKPLFGQPPVLAELHRRLLVLVHERRPAWQVLSTSDLRRAQGEVAVVRTLMAGHLLKASDRPWKTAAFVAGLLLPPLEFVHLDPVHETIQVRGLLEVARADVGLLESRLVQYQTQPAPAVDLSGLERAQRTFALDVSYTEGLFADQHQRPPVLVGGFAERLADAVIALVEGRSAANDPLPE